MNLRLRKGQIPKHLLKYFRPVKPSPAAHWKAKDLVNTPALLAESLRVDGWVLRSEIQLLKIAPMPESVRDRPSRACERLYLLTKRGQYAYDQEAEREDGSVNPATVARRSRADNGAVGTAGLRGEDGGQSGKGSNAEIRSAAGRNLWDWWEVPAEELPPGVPLEFALPPELMWWTPEPSKVRHYASFPKWLPRRCIKLGCPERGVCPACLAPWRREVERKVMVIDRSGRREAMGPQGQTQASGKMVAPPEAKSVGWSPTCACGHEPVPGLVLDPFCGSGTTGMVARSMGRRFLGVELSPEYAALARERISRTQHNAVIFERFL